MKVQMDRKKWKFWLAYPLEESLVEDLVNGLPVEP
jgi:hypothetical protein